jgi:hypothetical protein
MYSKLVIVDSMGDIVKEIFIVRDEKIVEGGGEQSAQALVLELVEFMTMDKFTFVQHEAILDPSLILWETIFNKKIHL